MLYSSTDKSLNNGAVVDANSYPSFKVVDSTVVKRIAEEMDALGDPEEERELSSRST
jgi:transcription initiation factor TFIIH subunit 3